MKKVVQYLGEYGLLKTIMQIFRRVGGLIGLLKSKTYILKKEIQEDFNIAITHEYQLKTLVAEDVEAFNKMKYFDFLDANNIVESKKMGATIALDGDSVIAYVCYDSSSEHDILNKTIENLQNSNIKTVVTAINYKNEPSIKSFEKTGFRKLGLIKLRNFFNCYSIIQVEEYTLNSIKSNIFSNKKRRDI